ncbi:MAG: serine/threonine protein kinase [Deltaproteobacteria bacterium]|nr:serine/threonine protein kinase [Deltaproteobacteria bacterium]
MGRTLQIGDKLEGKYEIRRKIGEGGMGVVYEGLHRDLEKRVAIKVLLPFEGDDGTMRNRFKVEAKSSASIKHPNVVEVHDFGFTPDDRPFFVMEYLEGESLADLLDRQKVLKQSRVVAILDQVLSGLARAHKKNIIHRDLKPENIFLSRTEDRQEVVKILDFGIAKILNDRNPPKNTGPQPRAKKRSKATTRFKTEMGVVMGTPGYMAPESLTGQGSADHRMDLFAVGVLLFEMLTGRPPFRGTSAHEIMVNTASNPVPRLRSINPGVTREMEQLCLIALAKDPQYRFQNATEFIEHLTAAAVGKTPPNARPCSTEVGLPSVIPKSVRVLDDDEPDELSQEKSLDLDLSNVENPQHYGSSRSQANRMPPRIGTPEPSFASSTRDTHRHAMQRSQPILPDKYVGPARRRRSEFSFSHVKTLIGIGIIGWAVYMIFTSTMFTETVTDNSGQKMFASPHAAAKEIPISETALREVTIDVNVEPQDAELRWNGNLILDRPFRVPYSSKPAKVEITKSGHKRKIMVVTPNDDKIITATLVTD